MGIVGRVGQRRHRVHPADHRRRQARARRVPSPAIAREHLPPLLLAQAELNDKELDHFTAVDMVDRAALAVESHDEFIAWASYERWPGRNEAEAAFMVADRPPGRGHRHAAARTPCGDRPLERHRALHRRGARRQPGHARRVRQGRMAATAAVRFRCGRPRLGPRHDRRVPRQRRTPRATRRLASRREHPDPSHHCRDRSIGTPGNRR